MIATGTVTAAQVNTLATVGNVITIPAPGAGLAIIPVYSWMNLIYGGVAFTGGSGNFAWSPVSSGATALVVQTVANLTGSTGNSIGVGGATSLFTTQYVNKAFTLFNTGTNTAGGTGSSINWGIEYMIVPAT